MGIDKVNDKLLWALSEPAVEAVGAMVKYGLDRDLAISVLEQLWPEKDIYHISDDDMESTK